jgi:N-acetylglucosamine-6-phosphate deacetylase
MTDEQQKNRIGATKVLTAGGWLDNAVIDVGTDGRVVDIRPGMDPDHGSRPDAVQFYEGGTIVPGLVDIQVNGGGGSMFSLQRDAAAYGEVAAAHGRTGTTSICPTIVTGPPDDMLAAVSLAADLCESTATDRARAIGIHIEGPFVDVEMRGGHARQHIAAPDHSLLEELVAAGRGHVRMYSLAPELPGALSLVRWLADRGIRVSAGHTAATAEQLRDSVRSGLTGVTHVFNGMAPLVNRAPGVAGVALSSHLLTGLIGDLLHVSADTVGVVVRAKNPTELYLTTDAVSPLGSESGTFDLYGTRVTVRDGGCYTDEGVLAGTATPLLQMVRNMLDLGVSVDDAFRMATATPASVVGRSSDVGAVQVGAFADLLVLRDMSLVGVFVGGHLL